MRGGVTAFLIVALMTVGSCDRIRGQETASDPIVGTWKLVSNVYKREDGQIPEWWGDGGVKTARPLILRADGTASGIYAHDAFKKGDGCKKESYSHGAGKFITTCTDGTGDATSISAYTVDRDVLVISNKGEGLSVLEKTYVREKR